MFGDFEVDLHRGTLTRHGGEIPLRPKSFAMLQYLLEHAGQLVTRDEMLAAVWPDVVVSDGSIAQCLIEVRRALGDDERSIIRTVPRRGLIFDVPIRVEDTDRPRARPEPSWITRHAWKLGAALVGITVVLLWFADLPGPATLTPSSERTSIAVLRFTDMSAPAGRSYLADGFSEEILHMLAQSPSLNVIARTSSFSVGDGPVDEIARRLGVSYILEGSVRRQDDEIRVTAQLVDATTSTHIWSKSFDRDLDHLIEVQKEIAVAVAGLLEASLADAAAMPAVDARAYELFLEAKFFYSRRAAGDKARAEARLEEALAIAPDFARAWSTLAAVVAAQLGDPSPGVSDPVLRESLRAKQEHAVEQALKYGPNLPEVHHRAAQYYFYNGERGKALEHLKIARSIDPDHWLVLVAQAHDLRHSGRVEESARLVRLNLRRDPLNVALRGNLISDLFWAGRSDAIGAELEKLVDLSPSIVEEAPFVVRLAAQAYILLGDFEGALTVIESMPEGVERLQARALLHHGRGHRAEPGPVLEELESLAGTGTEMFFVAEVHAYRQDSAQALAWLNRIEVGPDCSRNFLPMSIYYSPFLAMLGDTAAWEAYRSRVYAYMQGCRTGLDLEPDPT